MRILRDISPVSSKERGAVMALGNFDGLHLGHKAVIEQTIALARQMKKPAALMTFEPHPRRVFRPDLPTLRLLSFRDKAQKLREMGLNFVRVVHFTRVFSETTARAFVTSMLDRELAVSHIVTGEDFIFGHNREGNAAYLRQMTQEAGFGYTACSPVIVGGSRCSSTRVRQLLEKGEVKAAALLLGRPYSISGRVQTGDKRGRTLGFPTANIVPTDLFTPAAGVYAVRATLGGKTIKGVANLGIRPTFGGTRTQLEAHFFDWQGDLYGKRIEVDFVAYLRGEKKFNGIEALKMQIAQDCQMAKTLLTGA